jgi:sortase A
MSTGTQSMAVSEARDPERALRQISVGVGLLERRLARPLPDPRAGDDDLLMVSLALSLERIAGEADTATISPEQRAELASAAARIRAVIEELAGREQRRLAAAGGGGAVATLGGAATEEPEARARTWSAARIRVIVGGVLLALGLCLALFFVFEYTVTGAIQARSQQALLKQFGDRLALGAFNSPTAPIAAGPVAVLEIPDIGVKQVVVEGATTTDLKQGPGHVPGTPLPGEYGNAVVIGHRSIYGSPFSALDQLHPGADITVLTGQGLFNYTVSKVIRVHPGQQDVVGPTSSSRLTLVTSVSAFSSDRLAVIATLQGPPVGVPQRPPVYVGQDQLGMVGDSSGAFIAVLAAQALVIALIVAVRLYRRWPPAAAYLVTTPIILALLLVVFENLDRFLPGTL